jgi:hypothetical protein
MWWKHIQSISILALSLAAFPAHAVSTDVDATVKLAVCGDGVVESIEECDGSTLAGATCQSLGYATGTISCLPACIFNTSLCIPIPPKAVPVADEKSSGHHRPKVVLKQGAPQNTPWILPPVFQAPQLPPLSFFNIQKRQSSVSSPAEVGPSVTRGENAPEQRTPDIGQVSQPEPVVRFEPIVLDVLSSPIIWAFSGVQAMTSFVSTTWNWLFSWAL